MVGDLERRDGGADCEKRRGKRVEDYRGVTIMPALYKINGGFGQRIAF